MNFWRKISCYQGSDIWTLTLTQVVLMLICSSTIIAITWNRMPFIALTFSALVALAFFELCLLLVFQRPRPQSMAFGLYFINAAMSILVVTINQNFWLNSGLPFQPFFAVKFIAIIVALQAPTMRLVGLLSLGVAFLAPLAQYALWTPVERARVGLQEPWITCLAVACAWILYEQRLQVYRILQRKASIRAAAEEMSRHAHLLLGAQHLLNTPLQIIEGTSQLIRMKYPETSDLVDRIDRAFGPIKEINQLLSFSRHHVNWGQLQLPMTVDELQRELELYVQETPNPPRLQGKHFLKDNFRASLH